MTETSTREPNAGGDSEPMAQSESVQSDQGAQYEKPLCYEFAIEFSRPLDHRKDDPETLRSMLEKRSNYTHGLGYGVKKDDLEVTLEEFDPDHGAVVVVVADVVDDRPPLVSHIPSRISAIATRGYKKATEGDDLPRYNRLLIERALEGKGAPRGAGHGSKKKRWERAKATAERLDIEDAPLLGVDVHCRTLEGGST